MPSAAEQLAELHSLVLTGFAPEQRVIHKPNRGGTGQALKIQLRLEPKFIPGKDGNAGYFDREANKAGGLFLELAKQGPTVGENATFLWQDQATLVRSKLGMADITAFLAAIREYRYQNRDVPIYLQSRTKPEGNVVSLFHKFRTLSTAITYTFQPEASILRVSKSAELARSISLNLGEELIFEAMLKQALDAYLRVGKR